MRCGCKSCGAYMVHEEKGFGGCVCPECGFRCRDCLGTNTVISKEDMKKLKDDPFFEREIIKSMEEAEEDIYA